MRAALFAIAVLAAVPAQAQVTDTVSQRLEIMGDAPAACVFATPTASNGSNASFTATSATSARINITQLVNSADSTSLGSSIELSLPVICNASHRVVVRSTNGGLARVGGSNGSAGGFSEFLAYRFGLGWAGQQLDRSSDSGEVIVDAGEPAKGEVRLRIVTPVGSLPLVAGQYNDSIVIEFQAAN
jgi:hypothetical protein